MHLFRKNIPASLQREAFGLRFPHPVGLAPGADPQARKYNEFRSCSFVEIGPLDLGSPAQSAERKYGFFPVSKASSGPATLADAIRCIQERPPKRLIAANIAPVPSRTDCESVTHDLLKSFTYLYDFVDLFIVDTFRKNNDGVAPLQSAEYLSESMDAMIDMRFCYEVSKPILIRIDQDILQGSLAGLLNYMMYSGIDGIVAGYQTYPLELIRRIGYFTGGRLPIVACGGIDTPQKAEEILAAGATLIQTDRKSARNILNHLIDNASLQK